MPTEPTGYSGRYGWSLRDAVIAIHRMNEDGEPVTRRALLLRLGINIQNTGKAQRMIAQLRAEGLAHPDEPVRLTWVGESLANAYLTEHLRGADAPR